MNISIISKLECKGGNEWRLTEYFKKLTQRGHSVRLYCFRHLNETLKSRLEKNNIQFNRDNLFENSNFKIDCRENEILLISPVDEYQFFKKDWYESRVVNKHNIKKVIVNVNWGIDESRKIKDIFSGIPCLYLCANQKYCDMFKSFGLDARFVHTPIDESFLSIPRDYNLVTIGRHSRSFDYKFSQQYADFIKKTPYSFYLMGVSDKYRNQLATEKNVEIIKEYSIESTDFLKKVGIFLQINDPSYFEMSPRVVAEAMCAGIPSVCENRGGVVNQIEHGHDGFLFNSDLELGRIIKEVYSDRALREKIGTNAKLSAEKNFMLNGKILELEKFFNE